MAKDLVNFLWYLLCWSGLGPRLGSGELAITKSGVLTGWVIKTSVRCVYVDLLDDLVDKLLESGRGLSAGCCKVGCDQLGVTSQV